MTFNSNDNDDDVYKRYISHIRSDKNYINVMRFKVIQNTHGYLGIPEEIMHVYWLLVMGYHESSWFIEY